MYKIKSFFRKLFRVFSAFKLIWNCEEWDYSFTLELLRWRLERCIKYFERSPYAEGNNERAQEMKEVLRAIDEYFNPCYSPEPFDVSYVMVPTEDGFSRLMTLNKETKQALTAEEEEQYSDYLIASQKYEIEDCWNKIWDLIKEHGQGWWE